MPPPNNLSRASRNPIIQTNTTPLDREESLWGRCLRFLRRLRFGNNGLYPLPIPLCFVSEIAMGPRLISSFRPAGARLLQSKQRRQVSSPARTSRGFGFSNNVLPTSLLEGLCFTPAPILCRSDGQSGRSILGTPELTTLVATAVRLGAVLCVGGSRVVFVPFR
jgi:hypothetical protein